MRYAQIAVDTIIERSTLLNEVAKHRTIMKGGEIRLHACAALPRPPKQRAWGAPRKLSLYVQTLSQAEF